MTKNIIIAALSLTVVFFVVYANIKASESQKLQKEAELFVDYTTELQKEAKAAKSMAQRAAADARRATGIAIKEKEKADRARAEAELLKQKLALGK